MYENLSSLLTDFLTNLNLSNIQSNSFQNTLFNRLTDNSMQIQTYSYIVQILLVNFYFISYDYPRQTIRKICSLQSL